MIAIHTRSKDNTVLAGRSGTESFYTSARQNGVYVKLEYSNGILTASAGDSEYFTFYDNLLFEGDQKSSNCFTDLLDNLHEEEKTTDVTVVPMPF